MQTTAIGKPKLILIMGLPGSGKTHIAKLIAKRYNFLHISSDQIRIGLGLKGHYSGHDKQLVYKKMIRKAKEHLRSGCNIIIDTTFASASFRKSIRNVASPWTNKIYGMCTTAHEDTIKERISKKREDSEADYAVYLTIKRQFEPIDENHLVLPTDQLSDAEMIDQVSKYCDLTND